MSEKGSILPRSKGEVQEKLLRFGPAKGKTVEEAKADMIAAAEEVNLSRENRVQGKVPQFIQNARERDAQRQSRHSGGTVQIQPEPSDRGAGGSAVSHDALDAHQRVDAVEPERLPANVSAPEPTAPLPAQSPAPARIKAEDAQRIIEIYNKGKEWTAEIKYKNGRQPEVFKARSKDDLLLKIAEGKASATMKIHALNRRIAIGPTFDTWDDFLTRIQREFNVTAEDYNAMPQVARKVFTEQLQLTDERAFVDMYPEYYGTEDNYKAILAYLKKHNIPWTIKNLQIAYEDLLAQGALDTRPVEEIAAEEVEPEVVQPAPVVTVIAPVAAAPVVHSTVEQPADNNAPAPAVQVRKRGSTGLIPGNSSAVATPAVNQEAGNESREPSVKELKTMDIKELRRAAIPQLNRPSRPR